MKMLLSVLFLASTLLSCGKKSSDDDAPKDPRTDVSGGAAAVTDKWQNDSVFLELILVKAIECQEPSVG